MKKTAQAILFLLGITLACQAQENPTAVKYADQITEASATKHLTILASDEFEGRDTGKPGGKLAADYIANEFKKLGLIAPVDGSYFQDIPLVETSFQVNSFKINGQNIPVGEGFYMTGSGDQQTVSAAEIVFIGYGISADGYDDLKNQDIAGKVVLVYNKEEPTTKAGISHITGQKSASEWTSSRNKRIQHLIQQKPALILAVSPDVEGFLDRFKGGLNRSRMMLKEDYEAQQHTTPVVHLTPGLAASILGKKHNLEEILQGINQSGKPNSFVFPAGLETSFGTQVTDVHSQNVMGYLEGSDLKDELVVVSAHYDHVGIGPDGAIFNGADDDGSGTTGVLEMAQAFSSSRKDGHGPRRSILFLTVTGEEKGLLGSDYYTRHPIFPLAATVTNLNIDMIGRIDPPHEGKDDYIYLIGSDKLSSTLHEISEEVNRKYTKLDLDYKYNDPEDPERIYYRSDHYNFAKNGIPVIFYFNGVHADYHKETDTIEKINFEQLVKRTKLVFHTAWEVANRDQRLVVDSNKK